VTAAGLKVHVDAALIRAYGGSGDNLHASAAAARAQGFPDLVSWGGLTALPFHDLIEQRAGPHWMVGGSLSIRFLKPVIAGDTVEYRLREAQPSAGGSQDPDSFELEAVTDRNGVVAIATARLAGTIDSTHKGDIK
jgi:acyl dehydratase